MSSKESRPALRIGLVASRFNQFIVDQLLAGAQEALSRRGLSMADTTLVWVPGAFELPLAAEHLARSGQFSAIIALGAVIRGGTPHFDYVAGECAAGLGRVALDHGIPVMFGVLTTDTIEQALERAGTGSGNKGFDVAMAALDTVESLGKLAKELGQAGKK
jgi:6,7-dimethyl-8-ribityllumazine synthase